MSIPEATPELSDLRREQTLLFRTAYARAKKGMDYKEIKASLYSDIDNFLLHCAIQRGIGLYKAHTAAGQEKVIFGGKKNLARWPEVR